MGNNVGNNEDDDIVTLLNADGEEVDFVEIAGIAYKGKFYAILQPVELLDGMDDDEALVFRVTQDKNGEDKFEIELNDGIIDAVFKEYNRLLDEQVAGSGSGTNTPKQAGGSKRTNAPAAKTGNKGSKQTPAEKRKKIFLIFQPLVLAVVLFILAIVSSSLDWGDIATALLFVGAAGCVVWFVVQIVNFLGKKIRKK